MITLTAMLMMAVSANAMSYEQARTQALFLTDKMAYELNLTEEQYEAAYEVNLDYLMSVNTQDDLYGVYWTHRNLDLSYILFDWQYRAFCAATYFYRPLYWDAGYWHFGIYARYPHRTYYYFGYPRFWTVYRGGHSWHHNGGRSWYHGRDFGHHHGGHGDKYFGMRDGHKRGDYKHGFDNGRNRGGHGGSPDGNRNHGENYNGNHGGNNHTGNDMQGTNSRATSSNRTSFGGTRNIPGRESSTRTTVTRPNNRTTVGGTRSIGSNRRSIDGASSMRQSSSSRFGSASSSIRSTRSMSTMQRPSGSSFGSSRSMGSRSISSGSRSMSSGSRSMGGSSSRGGGHFGGRR